MAGAVASQAFKRYGMAGLMSIESLNPRYRQEAMYLLYTKGLKPNEAVRCMSFSRSAGANKPELFLYRRFDACFQILSVAVIHRVAAPENASVLPD